MSDWEAIEVILDVVSNHSGECNEHGPTYSFCGFDNTTCYLLEDAPIISAIRSDPDLASVRLIAEVWDISSYQLGRTFPGISWQQWNGKFRDDGSSGSQGVYLKQQMQDKLVEHQQYTSEHGQDMPEIREWSWPETLYNQQAF